MSVYIMIHSFLFDQTFATQRQLFSTLPLDAQQRARHNVSNSRMIAYYFELRDSKLDIVNASKCAA